MLHNSHIIKSVLEVGIAIGFFFRMTFIAVLSLLNIEFHLFADRMIPILLIFTIIIGIIGFFLGSNFASEERLKINNGMEGT